MYMVRIKYMLERVSLELLLELSHLQYLNESTNKKKKTKVTFIRCKI